VLIEIYKKGVTVFAHITLLPLSHIYLSTGTLRTYQHLSSLMDFFVKFTVNGKTEKRIYWRLSTPTSELSKLKIYFQNLKKSKALH